MTPHELPSLLSASPGSDRGRGLACPDEHQIAAYVDATLDPNAREILETHLADCDHCLALVGLLSRERSVITADDPSEAALERARRLSRPVRPRGQFTAPRWAAAAVVVVAVASLIRLVQPPIAGDASLAVSTAPATRSGSPTSSELTLLSPRPGATLNAQQLTIQWAPVPGAHYYDVRVVTDAGDVVTEEHVNGTHWRPPHSTLLRPGVEYFVHVDAIVADDKSISSPHVAFRVAD